MRLGASDSVTLFLQGKPACLQSIGERAAGRDRGRALSGFRGSWAGQLQGSRRSQA